MNVKIKEGAYCLIKDKNYDQVFIALQKQLDEKERQLFAERTPGSNYLQWTLPGDGWIALSNGDPLTEQLVRKELSALQQNVSAQFGGNQEMAQAILSVPSDEYVYYKPDDNGNLMIKLTAWGYRFPEIIGNSMSGFIRPKIQTEHIFISLVYGGKPMSNQMLRLNGFGRIVNDQGVLDVGDLPIGYQFDVTVENERRHITVTQGEGNIVIDLTEYAAVEIRALLDGIPYAGAEVELSYMGQSISLTCDNSGCAITKLPLDKDGSFCRVSIKDAVQQKVLRETDNVFVFQLETPPSPPSPEPQDTTVAIKAILNGKPYDGAKVTLSYRDKQLELVCDENGNVQTRLPFEGESLCKVSIDDSTQQEILKESGNVFVFQLEKVLPPTPPLIEETTVKIKVTRDGMPAVGTKVTLSYMNRQQEMVCDGNGCATVQLPLDEKGSLCKVLVGDLVQQEPLREGVNLFEFHLQSVPMDPPEVPGKTPWWMYLLEILSALLLVALLCLTFWFCGEMLFGGILK